MLTQSEISSRCSHMCLCALGRTTAKEKHMGFSRQLGMLCCWNEMKRMTREGHVQQEERSVTAAGPVARRRETWRRNGQRWEENQHWRALGRPRSERGHCQQCRLPQRVEIRSLIGQIQADLSQRAVAEERWSISLNNE